MEHLQTEEQETKKAQRMINPDPFAEVRMVNIENNGRKTDKFFVEMLEPKSGDFKEIPGLGTVHAKGYQLITNKQVHETAINILGDTGLEFTPLKSHGTASKAGSITWNGRSFSEKWACPSAAIETDHNSNMMLGFEITNSYDGTAEIGFSFFAIRMLCENQFYGSNIIGMPYMFPHVNRGGTLDQDMAGALNQLRIRAGNFGQMAPKLQLLQNTNVTGLEDFLNVRQQLAASTKVELRDKQVLDELAGCGITRELNMKDVIYQNPSTFWNIVNAYAAVTTHQVGGRRGSDQCGRITDWFMTEAVRRSSGARTIKVA